MEIEAICEQVIISICPLDHPRRKRKSQVFKYLSAIVYGAIRTERKHKYLHTAKSYTV